MKIERKAVIWYKDFEDLVREVYKEEPNFLDNGEFHNGSYFKPFEIDKDTDFSEPWEEAEQGIVDWIQDGAFVNGEYLLWDLIRRGHLPADDYMIEIWW